MYKAIIYVDAKSDDNVERPKSFLKSGGIGVLERQLRQLKAVGISDVYLMSFTMPEKLHSSLSKLKKAPKNVEVVDANFIDTSFWEKIDEAILVEEGHLIDERIYDEVIATDAKNTVALFDADNGEKTGIKINVNGVERPFASVVKLEGNVLKTAATDGEYKTNPVATILKTLSSGFDMAEVNIDKLEKYLPNRRRDVDILWQPINNKKDGKKGTKLLIDMAQKGTLDWPARWIHPFFENNLVYYSLPTPLTPNIVTVITAIVGFYITYLFANGYMGPALAGAMVIGVLDGLDGKLARVKMLQSRIGELEHILDKIVEYSWYLAMAYYFAEASGNGGAWAVGWLIILFAWAETVQGEFFRRLTGKQLDDTGVFERSFRLIGARRNTQIWALVPFAITNNWEMGFWMLAIYSAVTFFVAQWRFIVRTRDYTMAVSETIAGNINRTRYF